MKLETAVGNGWQAYGATIGAIRASIQASDGAYDVIAGWSARIPSLSLEGLFLDAQTISEQTKTATTRWTDATPGDWRLIR